MSLQVLKSTLKDCGFKFSDDKTKQDNTIQSKLEHQFVPALEFCGWLDSTTKEEYDLKKSVQVIN